MAIFWTSLSVLWSMIASVTVIFAEAFLKIFFNLDYELGLMSFVLFAPCIICLIIAGYLDWETIIRLVDRVVRLRWGHGSGDERPAKGN